jgi:hypothetical protein
MSASVSSKSTRASKKSHAAPVVEAPVEIAAPIVETHESVSEGTASEASEYEDEDEDMSEQQDEDEDDEDDEEEGDDVSQVNIDLSNNEFYKGMCTLLEDENGNNIVQYIDLLCDETKEIADNTKHLESIKNDIHKMAKLFERWVMLEEAKARHTGISMSGSSSTSRSDMSSNHHHSSSSRDDASVHTSKSSKSTKSSKH